MSLSAFTKANYKIETIKTDFVPEFQIYIPDNFCSYKELDEKIQLMEKIGVDLDRKNIEIYYYADCEKIKQFNDGNGIDLGNTINIAVYKNTMSREYDKKFYNDMFIKVSNLSQKKQNNIIANRIKNFDLEDYLNKLNIKPNQAEYLKNQFEIIKYFALLNKNLVAKNIDDNLIFVVDSEYDGKTYFENVFFGFIKNNFITIGIEGEKYQHELQNLKSFKQYIKENEILNDPQINKYIIKNGNLINIKTPDYSNYIAINNNFFKNILNLPIRYNKILLGIPNDNNGSTQVMATLVGGINKNILEFINVEKIKHKRNKQPIIREIIFDDKNVSFNSSSNDKTFDYNKPLYAKKIMNSKGKSSTLYYFFFRINGIDVILFAAPLSNHSITKEDETKLIKEADKYIEYLIKINK